MELGTHVVRKVEVFGIGEPTYDVSARNSGNWGTIVERLSAEEKALLISATKKELCENDLIQSNKYGSEYNFLVDRFYHSCGLKICVGASI